MEPSDRPYILLNYAMSLDGKLSTKDRDPVNFTSKKDRDLMDQIRSEVDAVLIGAGTLRAENPPVRIRKGDRRRERVNSNKQPHPISILLSRNLCFPTLYLFAEVIEYRKVHRYYRLIERWTFCLNLTLA